MTDTLAQRLRSENRDLHAGVESRVGLPGSVRSRTAYGSLLALLHRFHAGLEAELAAWSTQLSALGIELADYRRSHLLADDLTALGLPVPDREERAVGVDSFPEALGALYVAEGSSLGGRVIGPEIRTAIGEVPTRFFDGDGRGQPRPWHALKAAVDRFGADGGDADAVVAGARRAFTAFGEGLGSERWATA